MGAWGYGYFEDDSALDFMASIEDAANVQQLIEGAFDAVVGADYLEYDEGSAIIVSAAYVDRQLNGTKYSSPDMEQPLDVDTFPDRHPEFHFAHLRAKAVKSLKLLLGKDSELNELWAENEEDYPKWRKQIESLIARLDK